MEAVYTCDDGYVMEDNFQNKLFCRRRRWVGPRPVCTANMSTVNLFILRICYTS